MIYFIKFLYNWLLPPGIFILALVVIGLKLKDKKSLRLSILLVALGLYLVSVPIITDPFMRTLEQRYDVPGDISDRDVIVMLGYGAIKGTPDVTGEGHLTGESAVRLITTASLHFKTGLPVIISGGEVFVDSGNEAQIARRQLIALGVAADKIYIDDKSRTTKENALYTREIMKEQGFKKPLLVVSAFHMPRSAANFKAVGINDLLPYPTNYKVPKVQAIYAQQFVPSYQSFERFGATLREYMGIAGTAIF